jgi:hypothetical protein
MMHLQRHRIAALLVVGSLALAPAAVAAPKPATKKQFQRIERVVKRQQKTIKSLTNRVTTMERRHNELLLVHNEVTAAFEGFRSWTTEGFTLVNSFITDANTRHRGLAGVVDALGNLVICHIDQPAHGGAC